MSTQPPRHTNGTYHGADVLRGRTRRTRILVGLGLLISLVASTNVILVNNEMTRLEQEGSLAGSGPAHFVPSILANLQRAQQPANTVTAILADDPRHTVTYVNDKRALERWMAVLGISLGTLFIGLENTIPTSTARPRSPTGTDLSRLLLLVSLAYGALSIFESG